MAETTKQFHLGDILSITTGILLAPTKIEGVYAILNYMTRDSLFTHQLPRAGEECKPWLLRQHPQLASITLEKMTAGEAESTLASLVKRHGEYLPVSPIPQDDHERKDAMEEAVEMFGKDRVIGVVAPDDAAVEE